MWCSTIIDKLNYNKEQKNTSYNKNIFTYKNLILNYSPFTSQKLRDIKLYTFDKKIKKYFYFLVIFLFKNKKC